MEEEDVFSFSLGLISVDTGGFLIIDGDLSIAEIATDREGIALLIKSTERQERER